MKIFFYYLIDPRTKEKKYIGQTKNLNNRLSNHIYSASKSLEKREYWSKKSQWIRELLSIGLRPEIKQFEIFKGNPINAHRREWELIKSHVEKGYSLLNGNDGGTPYYFSDERVKRVYQYNKNTLVFIKEFRTAYDAYCETGIKDCNISRSCKSIEKERVSYAGGFLWSFEMFDIFPEEKIIFGNRFNRKKVRADNMKTGEIIFFDSARDAANILFCSYKEISECCIGNQKTHNGYRFEFVKDIV